MKSKIQQISFFIGLCFAIPVIGACPGANSACIWSGSQIQFGLNISTGNSNTTEVTGAINLDYAKNHWANDLDASGDFAKSNGVLSQQKYLFQDQVKYGFNTTRRHFVFARASWIEDYFSPYLYQTTYATGYGRDLINTERIILSMQIGPGYRYDVVRGSGDLEDRIIGTAQINLNVKIGDSAQFKQLLQYESGPPFQYINSNSAFCTKFSKHWSTQIAFNLAYYSRIPPRSSHTQKLDTATTASIVYNF